MILYWFLINILYLTFRVYFRRIYIVNKAQIRKNRAVFLTPNHPNSFIDGTILSVVIRRKLFLLARGDVFKKPLANRALRSMRLLPIYRSEDGAGNEQPEKNRTTYEECFEIFRRNGSLLIFPEGICVTERRLRPLKKGTARMIIEAFEKYPDLEIDIIPVGMNYSNPGKFREELCINFGQPINARDVFNEETLKSPAKAISDFNDQLSEMLQREMVIIDDPNNDELGDLYLKMVRNKYKPAFWGFTKNTKNRFLVEKRAANDLNELHQKDPQRFEQFKSKVYDYFKMLDQLKINEKIFSIPVYEIILYFIFVIILSIPALFGLILNFPPVVLSKKIAKKMVKRIEFYDSVNIGAGTILAFLYFSLLFLILLPFFGWKALLMVIGIRITGFIYLFWIEAFNNVFDWLKLSVFKEGRTQKRSLISQRKFILDFFNPSKSSRDQG
ncbi:MAG: 1-acyl-sn-glycerol-3-phosphate acyltransferase [Flavobacteriales bacterium]|nr:1-acyl-sn-glycerol-3-phosphate acyltransferase [Flavobacteriales bacterium]